MAQHDTIARHDTPPVVDFCSVSRHDDGMTVTSLRDFTTRYADDEKRIPEWSLGDRLTKSMTLANMSVAAMAEVFDVTRDTISRWINDRGVPKPMYLMLWADGCGVDLQWLQTGVPSDEAIALAEKRAETNKAATANSDGLGSVHPLGLEPRTQCLTAWAPGPAEAVNDRLTANRRGPILRVVRPVAA